jgi:hypothetical protein
VPVTCQDITVNHAQKIVNAAPTAGEGDRVHRMLSAMVSAGLKSGYVGTTAGILDRARSATE